MLQTTKKSETEKQQKSDSKKTKRKEAKTSGLLLLSRQQQPINFEPVSKQRGFVAIVVLLVFCKKKDRGEQRCGLGADVTLHIFFIGQYCDIIS